MLKTFIDEELEDACVLYIVDPGAIEECMQAGVGAELTLDVGGKSSPLQGEPVRMTAEVVALSDGRFRYDGPMYSGLEASMGPSAHIRQVVRPLRGEIHVLLVTEREQPLDTAFARTLGLDPPEDALHRSQILSLLSSGLRILVRGGLRSIRIQRSFREAFVSPSGSQALSVR